MAETTRLGLERFGGNVGGSLADNGFKFSNQDRVIIDRFLAALEGHIHSGGAALADPTDVPVLALNPAGAEGDLPGGLELFYRVSYVDEWGLESAASDEVSVTTPSPYPTPLTPAVSPHAGGALVNGTYYYAVTFIQDGLDGSTLETLASPTTVVTLASSAHTARVQLPVLPAGAAGWRLYRMAPGEAELFRTAELTDTALTFYDDAGDDGSNYVEPLENTTSSQNVVRVTIPDAALAVDPVESGQLRRWRIYRAYASGDYSDAALVHEVVETENEFIPYGPLVTSWDDVGDALLDGTPLEVSTTFNPPSPATLGGADAADVNYTTGTGYNVADGTVAAALDALDAVIEQAGLVVPFGLADGVAGGTMLYAGLSLPFVVPAPLSGATVEALSVALGSAVTAGTITVAVYRNGVAVAGATLVLGVGDQYGQVRFAPGTAFDVVANDRLALVVASAGPATPAPNPVAASLVVTP